MERYRIYGLNESMLITLEGDKMMLKGSQLPSVELDDAESIYRHILENTSEMEDFTIEQI